MEDGRRMTLEHYWMVLLKQWKLIVGCFLLVGLGTLIVSKLMTKQYQSAVVVQVAISTGSSQADYNNLLASDQLVQTEAQLATSGPVLREVASHGYGISVAQIYKEVSSSPTLNTQLFQINVLDPDPNRAAKLANDIAQTLIKQQAQSINQQNAKSLQQIEQDITTTNQQIGQVSSQIASLQSAGGHQAQVTVLQSQLSGLQQHYTQWQTLLSQLELNQAEGNDFLNVVQPAQPAQGPFKPNVPLNTAIGFSAGLLLGVLFAILFEQLDTRVRTPEMLTELVGWSVVGTIWRSRKTDPDKRSELVNPQGRDANVESYRILRTNVGFSNIDKPLHSLMVTSSMPGDGKSTVAANLAIFMAKAGKNTVLIDADLRRPVQHQIFNLAADKRGLSNAVLALSTPGVSNSSPGQYAGQNGHQFFTPPSPLVPSGPGVSAVAGFALEQFVHQVGVPNLRVMPSGPLPPNPSELLDSKAMQRLLTVLTNCGADVVIFDAPPIRGLSDSSIIASKVDGTLLVVDISRVTKGHIKQVKMLLTQAGANVIGCVVNKQRQSRNDSSYYYYSQDEQKQESNRSNRTQRTPDTNPPVETVGPANMANAASAVNAANAAYPDPWKGGFGRNGQ
jgi:Mrp family chromosome partitioning ATPase/capsular polysaccharide biosynthesis protein